MSPRHPASRLIASSLSAGAFLTSAALSAVAQEPAPAAPPEAAPPPAVRPAFRPQRSDENWSFFRPAADGHCLDPLKNIRISDDLSLSIGGDARVRYEGWRNFAFTGTNDDSFTLGRVLLHADLRAGDQVRVFVQGKSAFMVGDRDLPGGRRPLDVDTLDIQQGFVDLRIASDGTPANSVTVRAGRQELLLGRQRLVSPLPWSNTIRSWDGVRAMAALDDWRVDAFYTRFVPVRKYQFNDWTSAPDFWGIYATRPLTAAGADAGAGAGGRAMMDVYYLGLDTAVSSSFNGDSGPETRHSLGARFFGPIAESGISYDVEGAYQFGEVGPADIRAFMLAGELAWTPKDMAWSPRFWLGVDYASGDDAAADGKVKTFNHLFPLGHAFFGAMDFIGRQNLVAVTFGAAVRPVERLRLSAEIATFARAERTDAVYNAGGGVLRSAGSLSRSSHIGSEIDIIATYTVNAHLTLEAGYGHFFTGDAFKVPGTAAPDSDWVYLQASWRF